MSNIDFYLMHDGATRHRVTLISVLVGTAVGCLAESSGLSFERAAVFCFVSVGIVEIVGAVIYSAPDFKIQREIIHAPLRRKFIRAAFSGIGVLILALFRLPRLEAEVFERKLQRVSGNPSNPENISEARKLLEAAQSIPTYISPSVLKSAGQKFLEASTESAAAWPAALAFAAYRSFLNVNLLPGISDPRRPRFAMLFPLEARSVKDLKAPEVILSGYTTPDKAALYEPLLPRLNIPPVTHEETGNAEYVIIDFLGQTTSLDGMHLRNIVVKNARIAFSGEQPMRLENVYFADCSFNITLTLNGQRFVAFLLSSPATTFGMLDPSMH